jgi:hypothetical protein
MTKTSEKGDRAEALRVSKLFNEFAEDVREDQMKVFANTASKQEEREEAHSTLCALDKINQRMASAVMAAKIERKRAAKDKPKAD